VTDARLFSLALTRATSQSRSPRAEDYMLALGATRVIFGGCLADSHWNGTLSAVRVWIQQLVVNCGLAVGLAYTNMSGTRVTLCYHYRDRRILRTPREAYEKEGLGRYAAVATYHTAALIADAATSA
jgi:hypothetical protein